LPVCLAHEGGELVGEKRSSRRTLCQVNRVDHMKNSGALTTMIRLRQTLWEKFTVVLFSHPAPIDWVLI